jgi:hypothetical protein
MDEVNQEDLLDRQLRDTAPYVDDAGFTARVLQKLPPPQPRRESLRAIILLGITLLASVLAYVLSDDGRFIAVTLERLAILPMLWVFALAPPALLMTGLGLAAAISAAANRNLSCSRGVDLGCSHGCRPSNRAINFNHQPIN